MKTSAFAITGLLIFLASCTSFKPFNEDESLIFDLNRSEQLARGQDKWDGTDDCSAIAYLNKTATGLLLTIEVKDDSVRTGELQPYMNDGVELYFDLRPPRLRKNNYYEEGVFQAVILPDPGKKQVAPIAWYPKTYKNEVSGTKAYTALRDSGYVVQVTIPFSGLGRAHYWPRTEFYMDIAINDADSAGRESQIMWAGKSITGVLRSISGK
jgi:hypothetical protein